jgi:hypothetical protein
LRQKNIGKKLSDYTKSKISEAGIGNTHRLGKKTSEETKRKMSESSSGDKNARYGVKLSDELKLKISESTKDIPQTKLTCPHCSKNGGISNMKRYHFQNCKSMNGVKD